MIVMKKLKAFELTVLSIQTCKLVSRVFSGTYDVGFGPFWMFAPLVLSLFAPSMRAIKGDPDAHPPVELFGLDLHFFLLLD